MLVVSSCRSAVVRALVVLTLGVAGVAVLPTSSATASSGTAAQSGLLGDLLCAATGSTEPMPLGTALGGSVTSTLLQSVNDLTGAQVRHLAGDETSWIDSCGQIFVREEATGTAQGAGQAAAATDPSAASVPADVFDLSSRPQSTRTIYLDFDGSTYTGTRWRNGETIVSPAYSLDGDPTTFTAQERAQVFLAWQTVAEDYAPFDVNVTTRVPAATDLSRTSTADQTYGIPVVITSDNSVGASCGCAGQSYVGVFGVVNASDYQPSWVFTDGSGTGGADIGQAVSHEVGHTFGLSHDGTGTSAYYAGAKGWAPIMGASYRARASQWSAGEYPGANNTEDDVAIIARTAPLVADDHADSGVGATAITVGSTTAGMIGSRSDVDAFTFTAGGPVTLAVAGPAGISDTDLRVTVQNSLGLTVATVDAGADNATDASMSAVWSATLPTSPATYTALVDGVGNGSPSEAGRYSDYGSMGRYTVSLSAGLAPATTTGTTGGTSTTGTTTSRTSRQLRFRTTALPKARVGRKYRAVIRYSGPVTEARVNWRLPAGLSWRDRGHRIVIRGKVKARSKTRFTAFLSGDKGSVRMRFRIVAR